MPPRPPDQSNELSLGAVAGGRFRIVERLSRDRLGTLYRAQQISTRHPVVLRLLPEHDAGPGARRWFRREAQVLSRITHPHVARLVDIGTLDGARFYWVTEHLAGRPLSMLTADGPLPLEDTVGIARQICRGLQAIHAQQRVHGGLRSSRVWLSEPDGPPQIKLTDVGIARLVDARHGSTPGEHETIAPRRPRLRRPDPRTDLYALGGLLDEMLSGSSPVEGHPVVGRALRLRPSSVASALSALSHRLMAPASADRPASAWCVLRELERLIASHAPD